MDSSHKPRLCIALCEPTIDALKNSIKLADEQGDLIEVRLDCLNQDQLESSASVITEMLKGVSAETILTLRPEDQGGSGIIDEATRQGFWSAAIFSESFFDVELELAEKFNALEAPQSLPVDWSRTICSHHDFAGVPAQLDHIYERLAATPARILKIAAQANDVTDCLPLFHLLDRARADGREIIAIAMGTAGIATRILGPSRGAFLTYAASNDERATAPGQITAAELRSVYRFEQVDRQTQIFGLVGSPVSHSLSPRMHNAAFASAGLNAVYLPFEVGDVQAFLKRMIHPRTRELNWNVRGFSVTAPHKSTVMDHLDWIDPAAEEIGAVNTIVVEAEKLRGYNTDAAGLIKPLRDRLGDLSKSRCAIIGTGGVASAALWILKRSGARLTLFARDVEKGKGIAGKFGADWAPLQEASFADFDVVINATPLGTAHQFENQTPATAVQLRGARLAYDLVYNPTETKFLSEAQGAGCETLGGLAMLVAQGAEQFNLWTGESGVERVMLDAARKGLEA